MNSLDVSTGESSQSETRAPDRSLEDFPYSHLIFTPQKRSSAMFQHLNQVFRSLVLLESLSPEHLQLIDSKVQRLRFKLPRTNRKKKTLFLDLDETLIHTGLANDGRFTERFEFRDGTVMHSLIQLYFNVRPYAFNFIRNLSKYYEIAIFTASVNAYALEFFNFLNSKTGNSISHCLTRDQCVEIHPGIYFKDLRIIANRDEKDMVLVDNNAYSFSTLVDNGVPISNFTTDQTDIELLGL